MKKKTLDKNIIKGRWYNINKKIKKRITAKYHKIKDWRMDPKGYFLIAIDKNKKIIRVGYCKFTKLENLPINDMPEKFNVEIYKYGKNKENVVNKSKTTGEPPLMNAMSVFFAIKNAIASIGDHDITPDLNAPATPEKILMSINQLRKKEL